MLVDKNLKDTPEELGVVMIRCKIYSGSIQTREIVDLKFVS